MRLLRCIRILQMYSPSLCLIQQFAGNANEHAVSKGRLETRLCELVKHLGHSKTVVLPEVIQQTQGMVLQDKTQQNNSFKLDMIQFLKNQHNMIFYGSY